MSYQGNVFCIVLPNYDGITLKERQTAKDKMVLNDFRSTIRGEICSSVNKNGSRPIIMSFWNKSKKDNYLNASALV